MIGENIQRFRKEAHLSQEELAEQVGVARQTVAKWENGTTVPDIYACMTMADVFEISLDALAMEKKHPNPAKHMFGAVRIGERGQIVIPKKCREIFDLKPGDMMVLFGDEQRGLALVKLSVDMFDEEESEDDNV
ncbi:MAG: helix-turn-helix domain-containing protein [Clostridia bacterium]|nr:helix-turn-helix domain-containing protein [Clostridia bacterium]MBO5258711.1 helix-turn-helix domain-containing protein [Clostridia bacterium]MBP3292121.1 helix-turn-helix domain-containing protein [Clostridia bacterium]